jgi:Putative transposase
MTLVAEEFIRRFLLHVLPEGFQRIRYYGLLTNRYRAVKNTVPATSANAAARSQN